jgi:hypothetical protein
MEKSPCLWSARRVSYVLLTFDQSIRAYIRNEADQIYQGSFIILYCLNQLIKAEYEYFLQFKG